MHIPQRTCVVCDTPLSATEAKSGVLCGSAMCAWRYQSVPVLHRCVVCGRALRIEQVASRTCGHEACRRQWLVERSIAYRREKRVKLEHEATRLREHAAATHHVADSEAYTLTIVPHNYAQSSRLPVRRKRKLREHLRTVLAKAITHREAVANGTDAPRAPLPPLVPPKGDVAQVLMQACIGCRGYCCRTGGEHAYITPYTMLDYTAAHPDQSQDEIVDAYMSHLPERSLTEGCVYQGVKGCVLPREMRGDTCNRFYCNALKQFQEGLEPDAQPRAFFVPMHDLRFTHVVFASPDLVQIVHHRSTTMDV